MKHIKKKCKNSNKFLIFLEKYYVNQGISFWKFVTSGQYSFLIAQKNTDIKVDVSGFEVTLRSYE